MKLVKYLRTQLGFQRLLLGRLQAQHLLTPQFWVQMEASRKKTLSVKFSIQVFRMNHHMKNLSRKDLFVVR